jgi:DNA-binding CsgD family transcriptional regulator
LEYSTVTIFATFLILVTTLVMAVLSRQLKGGTGWIFLIAGGILIMASGLTEEIPVTSAMQRVYWGTVFIAFNIFGIAIVYSGMKALLNVGVAIRWYIVVALANAVAISALYITLPQLRGLRTITYGTSLYLLSVPILVRDYASPPVYRFQRLFDALLAGFLASYGLRIVLAFLDIREDNFIPDRIDSWIVLLYSMFGLLFLIAFILMALSNKGGADVPHAGIERPLLSLSANGLSRIEATYVRSILQGRSVKETAHEAGVSESTVRNTLARVYKKLGVNNMVGLMALAGRVEIGE